MTTSSLTNRHRKFHISIERDEAGLYVGRCRELPNAFTQAKSIPELKERMAEVVSLIIEEIVTREGELTVMRSTEKPVRDIRDILTGSGLRLEQDNAEKDL